jgi:hypothetical protein
MNYEFKIGQRFWNALKNLMDDTIKLAWSRLDTK